MFLQSATIAVMGAALDTIESTILAEPDVTNLDRDGNLFKVHSKVVFMNTLKSIIAAGSDGGEPENAFKVAESAIEALLGFIERLKKEPGETPAGADAESQSECARMSSYENPRKPLLAATFT